MVPGHGQAYLGAFVDPSGGIPRTQYELEALPPFNQELARHLSIVRIAQPWTKPTTDDQLNDVLAQGGIPLIDWACGVPDRAIVAGTYDNAITAFAGQLAAWGAPMFLSWFPDPNVSGGNTAQCLGPAGAHGYQRAFQHIRHLFVAAGARNVAFVWSVAAQGGDPDWSSYYPGANSVNWIAASGNIQGKTIRPNTFANYFNLWYSTFSAYGKPLMIGQTATSSPNQAPYLQQVATDLPAQFPLIKAFVYWDAPGAVAFQLGPAGLPAFEALSSDTYFQPKRHASSVTITVAPNPAATGQDVHFTTSIASSDQGGTISYYANGTLIAGCTAIPIEFTTACDTDSLPAGHDTVRAVYGGDAEFAGSRSPPVTVVVAPAPPPAGTKTPMVPSAGHAYLGGWINPIPLQDEPPGTTHMEAELKALPGFDAQLNRPLSIVHAYQEWTNLTPASQLRQVLADGSIPLIDWSCGDTDANIVAGHDDALITSFAQELAGLKAPIFLRWYYEPNFPGSVNYQNCIAGGGPAGYVQAWQHIHNLFMATGATNVAFVWAIALAGNQTDITSYYPGPAYVDWIGADGYFRSANMAAGQDAFGQKFSTWYSEFASFGKPLMVSETGAFAGSQSQYLQNIASDLANMPAIKALAYFDAPAHSGAFPYALNAAGTQAFAALSQSSLFQPDRAPSTVTVAVSPGRSHRGESVRLTASVDAADLGGTVSYSVEGKAIAGCQSLPISITYSCGTDALPPGTNMITATYSGDAEFGPAASSPLAATVTQADAPAPPPAKTPKPPHTRTRTKTSTANGSSPSGTSVNGVGSGGGPGMSAMSMPSINVPVVAPLAPLGAMSVTMPLVSAPGFASPPPLTLAASGPKSQNPTGIIQFASRAVPSAFRSNKWVLLGLIVVVGLCGYIGGTWIMDQLARRRVRQRP